VSDQLATLIPLVHAGATWFMTGLIWFVQIVHYPLMGAVQADAFPAYEVAHQRRTTWVVGPVMLIEASCAVLLFWLPHGEFTRPTLRWCGRCAGSVWLFFRSYGSRPLSCRFPCTRNWQSGLTTPCGGGCWLQTG